MQGPTNKDSLLMHVIGIRKYFFVIGINLRYLHITVKKIKIFLKIKLNFFNTCDVAWHVIHVAVSCRQSNAISCWLTEKFDGGDKLINVWQYRRNFWSFTKFRKNFDENYNFNEVIVYSLDYYYLSSLTYINWHG